MFRFLDENPSLKIEEENFDVFEKVIDQLDESFKNDLKQVDFEIDEVNQWTINSFLIAQFENQLSTNKEQEINDFLVQQPKYKFEQKLIQSTILVPDLSITYLDKKSLKISETRFLWPIISSVAAVLVILLLVINSTSTSIDGGKKTAFLTKKSLLKNEPILVTEEINSPIQKVRKDNVKFIKSTQSIYISDTVNRNLAKMDKDSIKNEYINNDDIDNEEITLNTEVKNSEYIPSNSSEILVSKSLVTSKVTFDCVSALDKYPIESFTTNLSTILKRQVEFKTCRNTKSNKTGFYLKIGKFIISKQTT